MDVKLDVGIPLPPRTSPGSGAAAVIMKLLRAETGTSVFFPCTTDQSLEKVRSRILEACKWVALRETGRKSTRWIATRRWQQDGVDGVRVWKTANLS
jgi:hypothetical protein